MAKKSKSTTCKRQRITIAKKRGGSVTFMARRGPGCGPRTKFATAHLKPYQKAMQVAAPQCAGTTRTRQAFRKCMKRHLTALAR